MYNKLYINKQNNRIFFLITLLGLIIFYLFFALYDGYFICVDSPSYLNMSFSREPVYPLFLFLIRVLFQTQLGENYLLIVVIIQSILASICSWSLADYIRKHFQISYLASIVLYIIPVMVSLLNRFAAKRSSMYSNSILTEGITISLYLLCFRYMLEYAYEHSKKSFIAVCILIFILVSTRKQMLIFLPIFFVLITINSAKKKQLIKGGIFAIFTCFILLFSISSLDHIYNYVLRGELVGHSSDNRFLSTMIFYASGEEDAMHIEDADIRDLYLSIYDNCNENHYLYNSVRDTGWLNEVSHFGDSYDKIQIDTMWPMIIEHVAVTMPEKTSAEKDLETDKINTVIINSILPHMIPELLHLFINNFLSGLVTTVAQRTSILIYFAIISYFLYLLLTIYQFFIIKSNKGNRSHAKDSLVLSLLCLSCIMLNVGIVSMVIFCQTRYTIYNMPIFYMSGFVLLYHTLLTRINKV